MLRQALEAPRESKSFVPLLPCRLACISWQSAGVTSTRAPHFDRSLICHASQLKDIRDLFAIYVVNLWPLLIWVLNGHRPLCYQHQTQNGTELQLFTLRAAPDPGLKVIGPKWGMSRNTRAYEPKSPRASTKMQAPNPTN